MSTEDTSTRSGFRKALSELFKESKADAESFSTHAAASKTAIDIELNDARDKVSSINTSKDEADTHLSQIRNKSSEVDREYAEFKDITSSINNPRNGVTAKLKKIEESHTNATTYAQETKDHRDKALLTKGEIEKLHDSAKTKEGEISNLLGESEDIKDKIQKTYKLATDLGLAGALFTRKGELQRPVYLWLASFIFFGGATFVIIFFIVTGKLEGTLPNILSRLAFVTPTLAMAIFSFTQYKHERRLLEEYSFRAAMAQSLESYTELLSREFGQIDSNKKILDFVLTSMGTIFDRKSLDNNTSFFQFGFKSQFASLETVIKDEAQGINKNIDGLESTLEKPTKKSAPSPESQS